MANRCLQGRGYMVVGFETELALGVFHGGTEHRLYGDINYPLVLIAKTDREDAIAQAEFLGIDGNYPLETHYYRAVAE